MNPRRLTLGIFAILFLSVLTACATLGRATLPEAEKQVYQTIGTEFAAYVENSQWTDQEKAEAFTVLEQWEENGSTIATYEYVAPRYTTFVLEDPNLDEDAREARLDINLAAWKIRLDELSKLPPPED